MNRKKLIELMAALGAAAALCGCASTPTPQQTADTPQHAVPPSQPTADAPQSTAPNIQRTANKGSDASSELGATRSAWAQCIQAAIPRLDDSESSSEVAPSGTIARAAMKACSHQYSDMLRALTRTLAPTCGGNSDCRRRALANAEREAMQTATDDVVTARVRASGAAALRCQ